MFTSPLFIHQHSNLQRYCRCASSPQPDVNPRGANSALVGIFWARYGPFRWFFGPPLQKWLLRLNWKSIDFTQYIVLTVNWLWIEILYWVLVENWPPRFNWNSTLSFNWKSIDYSQHVCWFSIDFLLSLNTLFLLSSCCDVSIESLLRKVCWVPVESVLTLYSFSCWVPVEKCQMKTYWAYSRQPVWFPVSFLSSYFNNCIVKFS